MILILKLDLNMGKVYLYTRNGVPLLLSFSSSNVIVRTDRQMGRHTD